MFSASSLGGALFRPYFRHTTRSKPSNKKEEEGNEEEDRKKKQKQKQKAKRFNIEKKWAPSVYRTKTSKIHIKKKVKISYQRQPPIIMGNEKEKFENGENCAS